MAVLTMRRFSLTGLSRDRADLLDSLQRMGVAEISSADGSYDEDDDVEVFSSNAEVVALTQKKAVIERVIELLGEYEKKKKPLFHARRTITLEQYKEVLARADELMRQIKDIEQIDARMKEILLAQNTIANQISSLLEWRAYKYDLSQTQTRHTSIMFGVSPFAKSYNAMRDELEAFRCYAVDVSSQSEASLEDGSAANRDNIHFALVYHKEDASFVDDIFKKYECVKVDFQEYKGTPEECMESLNNTKQALTQEFEELTVALSNYTDIIKDLEVLYDSCILEIDKETKGQNITATKYTFTIEGWIPAKLEKKLSSQLADDYVCHVTFRDPIEGELPPTALSNGLIGSSAENVMKMYGMPSYFEFDPSGIAGIFYVLFFGFMLSDAGYGILLTLICAIVLKKFKLEQSMRRFITLFFMCGISTVFWGVLFGGWFGDLIPTLTVGGAAIKPLWFNPIDNPKRMMVYAMALGVVHLYVGLAIKGYNLIRRRKWVDALCDVGFWYIFFTGEILYLLKFVPYVNEYEMATTLQPYGLYLLIAGFVLILFTKCRKSKNLFIRMFGGVTALYSLVNMLSDVMSYTRMMAMGLATSVTINAFNLIASMAGGIAGDGLFGSKIIGFVVFFLIFIVANLFNLAINLLGSYVNAARLMFIEFFNKFFEGGGREFQPLSQNTEYIIIE